MSNLKSKTLKVGGLAIAMAMMLGVAAVASAQTTTTTVVASGYTYSGVMKAGMSGPGISTLQAALNEVNSGTTIVVDGKFGPATAAAVMKFQASHGLTADGVVGPKTGAALTAATVAVITVPSGFPAGCTSNAGFSTTTGMSCAVSLTLPAGCTSTAGFSPTTGVKCSTSSSSLPAGCSSTSGFSSTTGMSCSGGASSGSLSGGETSISDVNVNDADDDTINEDANKAPVAQIEFDVDDADAELVRADVVFQSNDNQTGNETKPWKAFDKVYLMDGSNVLSSVDASDEDNWDDADDIGGNTDEKAYRVRFNDINQTYQEGDTGSVWVAVDVASSVDGSDTDNAGWTVGVESDGLRFTDEAGLDTEESTSDTANFSIEQAGAQSEVTVTEADNSPDANTLEVKGTTSTEQTVGIFTIEADEDGGDVKLDDFPVGLKLTVVDGNNGSATSDFDDVISDVYVTIDGTKYTGDYEANSCDSVSATLADCTAGQTATFRFNDIDDDDITIDAGDSLDAKVSVKFRSQGDTGSAYGNGTTVQAFSQLDEGDVEDADSGDDITDVSGSAQGEVMTLAGEGIMVVVNDATTDITTTDDGTAHNDVATFTWDLDITAFGDDVYLTRDFANIVAAVDGTACIAADGGTPGDVDDCYDIQESTGAAITGSGTITDTSDAQEVVGVSSSITGNPYNGDFFYKISKNQTESFTIVVTGTNNTDDKQVRALLSGIQFTTDNVTDAAATGAQNVQTYTANLASDSQTPFKAIQ